MKKFIKGTNKKYYITDDGKIFSYFSNRFINPRDDGRGTLTVDITINGKRKSYKFHRLVAEHFVENKNNYKNVKHIDGNKKNNKAENLMWY